jgi:resuscitation-promoting factor RpfA
MDSLSPALAARSAVPAAAPAFARPLTPGESAHLDRLREWLRGDGTDASVAPALDARWERLLETHPPEVPAPAGVVAAIGIAVGDLLVASVPDAVWQMCPGPDGATPGVLLVDRPHMPVLPVLDAHARWRVRSSAWVVDYVQRATAHLLQGRPGVPTPHPSPEAVAVPAAPLPEPTAEPTHAVAVPPEPETAAWTPTFVEDPAPEAETAAWTPTFVEDPTPEPETAAWTPTFVEDAADVAGAVEPYAAPTPWEPTPETTAFPTPGRGMPVTAHEPLTPEDLPHRPSERVQDLALRALELALDRAVSDAAGCAPFVLVREQHDVEVLDFPNTDAGVAQARDAARAGGYTAAAVAWTSPADASRPYPRVVVDASSAGRPGIRVAHSFLHDERGGHEVGGPQVVGQAAPVL